MQTLKRVLRKLTAERIGWLLLLGFLLWKISPQAAAALGVASMNEPAPAFELTLLDGTRISSEDLGGQVVLINFWASWCGPCRVEMPGFQRVYDEFADRGFVVLGISTDAAGRRPVEAFLEKHDITYPVAMATGRVVNDYGGARVLPTSFLVDRAGLVRHEVRGYFAEAALRQAVRRLVEEEGVSPANHDTSGAILPGAGLVTQ
jgi:peroxiredoxin